MKIDKEFILSVFLAIIFFMVVQRFFSQVAVFLLILAVFLYILNPKLRGRIKNLVKKLEI